jgi:hypothetical protein
MGRYTVHMTFETPGQIAPVKIVQRLPGRAASMELLGGAGSLAVAAAKVSAESPADAAQVVVQAVDRRWDKRRGPLTVRSWTASRERVLFGARNSSAWTGHRDDDEGGTAGVREPRRPLPGPGSLHAEREQPGAQW